MRRSVKVFLAAILISFAGLSGAQAAPQILALLATAAPVPLTCANGVCEAEFPTMCMQKDRPMPDPGAEYAPADGDKIILVVKLKNGTTARIPGFKAIRYSVPRTYVSVTAAIPEARLAQLGAVEAAIEIAPLASMVPVPEEGDTWPLTAEEIARVTTVSRMTAYRTVKVASGTVAAARLTSGIANALRVDAAPTVAEQEVLWRRVVRAQPDSAVGVPKAREMFEACRAYAAQAGEEGLRGCLQFRHDYLMYGINKTYWHQNAAGS